ncbi:MAG TPA: PilZ domain-containing protein [Candidatus Omnitrophota bacterium]|nr:PilZ domain-containing protein [Candidatus Omnitrophota bacterium]
MFEKRRYKRIVFREAIEFHVLPGGPAGHGVPLPSFGGCLSWDLSEGGLRFRAYSFIPLNTDLSVEFSIDHDQSVTLIARVVWVQKLPHSEQYNLGLEFAKTPQNIHGQRLLHRYLMKYLYPQRKSL